MRIFQRTVRERHNGWERRIVRGDGKFTAKSDKHKAHTLQLKVPDEEYIAMLLREGWKEIK